MTAVAGSVFTAAQFNQYVRDNLNECPAAKATTQGSIFVTSDTNRVAERIPAVGILNTSGTTTSTAYADLASTGPSVSVTTGVSAIVLLTANLSNNTVGQNAYASYEVSGATSATATDDRSVFLTAASAGQTLRATQAYFETGLTPGTNTFNCKYRVTGGTGTFTNRRISVIPF
ncbi:hypothetical protein ACH4F6_37845 [Streptomyces sp. NPDC017936]|uniref:hypothetical protein n=1 Tax=Streptomyces sp. NPDC017936 TaxID=3365016 RepID=UPI0037B2D20C